MKEMWNSVSSSPVTGERSSGSLGGMCWMGYGGRVRALPTPTDESCLTLCVTAGDGHVWQTGGNNKCCYVETES